MDDINNLRMKKFKHKRVEICKITGKDIDTKKDRYSIILHCEGDIINEIEFYKTDILRDLLLNKGERVAKQIQSNIMNQAKEMLESIGLIKPEYEVTGGVK